MRLTLLNIFLIINYNLYANILNTQCTQESIIIKKLTDTEKKYLTPCRLTNSQKKISHNLNLEDINQSIIFKKGHIQIPYFALPSKFNFIKKKDNNNPNNKFRFYVSNYINIYDGQSNQKNNKLFKNYENLKFGMQFTYLYNNTWKMYTDSRILVYNEQTNLLHTQNIYVDIKKLYLQTHGLFTNQMNILIGRTHIYDSKSWWYDNYLDILRLSNLHDLLQYELYLGGRLNDTDIANNTVNIKSKLNTTKFSILKLNYTYDFSHYIEILLMHEINKPSSITLNKLTWLGINLYGLYTNSMTYKLKYWLNLGYVQGQIPKITNHDISGIAFDITSQYIPNNSKFSYAYSLAYGEGNKNKNKIYVQPYIADNKSNFLSKPLRFNYYGEFLRPSLTNISIFSLFSMYRHNHEHLSVIALHTYNQIIASNNLDGSRYIYKTNGIDKQIGYEVDFLYRYTQLKKKNIDLSLAYFHGGNAFNGIVNKKDAFSAKISFTYYH